MTNLETVFFDDYVKGLGLNTVHMSGQNKTNGVTSLKADEERRVVIAVMSRHAEERALAHIIPYERVACMVPAAKDK